MNVSGRPELASEPICRRHFEALGFTLEGASVAGVKTWLSVPQWSLAIDCGAVPPQVVRCRVLALTHAHMDHAGGLGTWLAMRRLYSLGRSTVLAPKAAIPALQRVIETWESLHRHPFDWELIGMSAGDRYTPRPGLTLEALPADHVISTLGWAVWRTKHHLVSSLVGATGAEIKAQKAAGVPVTARTEELLLAVSGDTRATMPRVVSQLREAAVTCMEATFLDQRCDADHATAGGHTHIDQLRDVAWATQTLVPYHISQRYDVATARRLIAARLGGLTTAVWPLLPAVTSSEAVL